MPFKSKQQNEVRKTAACICEGKGGVPRPRPPEVLHAFEVILEKVGRGEVMGAVDPRVRQMLWALEVILNGLWCTRVYLIPGLLSTFSVAVMSQDLGILR